jgi:hypothetical protein
VVTKIKHVCVCVCVCAYRRLLLRLGHAKHDFTRPWMMFNSFALTLFCCFCLFVMRPCCRGNVCLFSRWPVLSTTVTSGVSGGGVTLSAVVNVSSTCSTSQYQFNVFVQNALTQYAVYTPTTAFINCAANCVSCATANTCGTCSGTTFLNRATGTCSQQCPPGFYGNTATRTCDACSSNCAACASPMCTTCAAGYVLDPSGICVSGCPAGYAVVDGACQVCGGGPNAVPHCVACATTGTNCATCVTGWTSTAGQCVSNCPAGQFSLTSGSGCAPCVPSLCDDCASATACRICSAGAFLKADGTCTQACPDGFYGNPTTGKCVACGLSCAKCATPSGVCQACASPLALNSTAGCTANCPAGTAMSNPLESPTGGVNTCVACASPASNCLSCEDASHCSTCAANLYNDVGQCVFGCPVGKFPNSQKVCVLCGPNCHQCDLTGKCQACSTGYVLRGDGTCATNCPSGTFANGNVCQACQPNCGVCSSLTRCDTCIASYELMPDGTCTSQCPDKFFQTGSTCTACESNCNRCTSTTTCSACDATAGTALTLAGTCVMTCPVNQVKTCPGGPNGCICAVPPPPNHPGSPTVPVQMMLRVTVNVDTANTDTWRANFRADVVQALNCEPARVSLPTVKPDTATTAAAAAAAASAASASKALIRTMSSSSSSTSVSSKSIITFQLLPSTALSMCFPSVSIPCCGCCHCYVVTIVFDFMCGYSPDSNSCLCVHTYLTLSLSHARTRPRSGAPTPETLSQQLITQAQTPQSPLLLLLPIDPTFVPVTMDQCADGTYAVTCAAPTAPAQNTGSSTTVIVVVVVLVVLFMVAGAVYYKRTYAQRREQQLAEDALSFHDLDHPYEGKAHER